MPSGHESDQAYSNDPRVILLTRTLILERRHTRYSHNKMTKKDNII